MKIITIAESYYFPLAIVIITECGHRHLRPIIFKSKYDIGDDFRCYCEDEK